MKILIIGGTVFLGRHIVDTALKNGHEVVLFNRGMHNSQLYPNLRKITGNRDGDITKISEDFDAVIDTCGYVPRVVEQSASHLKDKIKQYVFVSTISVYENYKTVGIEESYPVGKLKDESTEKIDGETYGPLKALCESVVLKHFPENSLIVRPGLIVGQHDQSDRFSYWIYRVNEGGEVLAPGGEDYPVQFIDVRDLAEWIIYSIENQIFGVYNATGPDEILTMGEFLETTKEVLKSNASFTWVDDYFLDEENIQAYMQMPLWVPLDEETLGFSQVNIDKALAKGLKFRDLKDTIKHTFDWFDRRPSDYQMTTGISIEQEIEILKKYREISSENEE